MDELSLITLAAAKSYTDEHGGGGGGTSNYNDLSNKPQIGGVTLSGNKSASDLGLVAAVDGKGLSTNDYTNADKAIVGGVTAALADKADKSAVKNEFIGTLAEWNALTAEQKKAYDTYQITDDYTEGSGGLPDYSTTEQLTGQKWIDGKDIYERTYQLILNGVAQYSIGGSENKTYLIGLTGYDIAFVKDLIGVRNGMIDSYPIANTMYYSFDSSVGGVFIAHNYFSYTDLYVTVQYTKA